MPPLILFGRTWHVSSDDLTLPGIIGCLFHGTWCALIVAEVAIIGLPDDCPQRALASSSILCLLASFAFTTILQVWVTAISMKGVLNFGTDLWMRRVQQQQQQQQSRLASVCDHQHITPAKHPRRESAASASASAAAPRRVLAFVYAGAMLQEEQRSRMPLALYCLLTAYAFEAAALTFLTVVTFQVLDAGRVQCYTDEELHRTQLSKLAVMPWFIYTTWAAVGLVGGLLVLLYNLYPDRGLDAWVDRVNCLSYALCCWRSLQDSGTEAGSPSQSSQVMRLARVLGDLSYPLDFSFTDVVAALTLVGITHRSRAAGTGSSSHNHALIAAAAAGLLEDHRKQEVLTLLSHNQLAAAAGSSTQHASSSKPAAAQQQQPPESGGMDPSWLAAGSSAHTAGQATSLKTQEQRNLAQEDGNMVEQLPDAAAGPVAGSYACKCTVEPPGAAAAAGHGGGFEVLLPVQQQQQQQAWLPFLRSALFNRSSSRSGGARAAAATCADVSAGDGGNAANLPESVPALLSGDGKVADGCCASSGSSCAGLANQSAASTAAASSAPNFVAAASSVAGSGSYNSLFELAVRQSSTLAVAPGYALKHSSTADSSRLQSLSANTEGGADEAAGSSRLRFSSGAGASGAGSNPGLSSQKNVLKMAPAAGSAASGLCELGQHGLPPLEQGQCEQHPGPALLLSPTGSSSGLAAATPPPAAHCQATGTAAAGLWSRSGGSTPATAMSLAPAMAAVIGNVEAQVETAVEQAVEDESAVAVFSGGDDVPLQLLEEALHWHRYALAVYGWPMFLWSHRYRVLRCCGLCCGRCCSCVQLGSNHNRRSSSGTEMAAAVAEDEPDIGDLATDWGLAQPARGGNNTCSNTQAAAAAAAGGAQGVHSCGSGRSMQGVAVAEGVEVAGAAGPLMAAAGSCGNVSNGTASPSSMGSQVKQTSQAAAMLFGDVEQGFATADELKQHQHQHQRRMQLPAAGGSITVGLAGDDCCWCCGGDWGASHVPKLPPLTASQRLTREAMLQTANIPDADLLHVNYHNLVEGLLPYSVALDVGRRCVVLAIRGSLSVEDCVTDVLYDPAPLDEDWLLQPFSSPSAGPAVSGTEGPAAAAAAAALPQELVEAAIAAEHHHHSASAAADSSRADSSGAAASSVQQSSPFETAAAAAAVGGEAPAAPVMPVARSAAAAAAAAAKAATAVGPGVHLVSQHSHSHSLESLPLRATQSVNIPAVAAPTAAAAAAGGGGGRRGSWDDAAVSPGSGPTRHLLSSSSHNFMHWRRHSSHTDDNEQQEQQQHDHYHRRRHTTSSRVLLRTRSGGGLISAGSANLGGHVAAGPEGRANLQLHRLSQVQRTTAADRALGAARAGHRHGPMTSAVTEQHAAAIAAGAHSPHGCQQQQQQGPAAAGTRGSGWKDPGGQQAAQNAAAPVSARAAHDQTQQHQQCSSSHSISILDAAAASASSSPSSIWSPSSIRSSSSSLRRQRPWSHQHAHDRPGSAASAQLELGPSCGEPSDQLLWDGGPTDRSLLSKAAPMTASKTAATHAASHAAVGARVSDGIHRVHPESPLTQQQQHQGGWQPAAEAVGTSPPCGCPDSATGRLPRSAAPGAGADEQHAGSWISSLQTCSTLDPKATPGFGNLNAELQQGGGGFGDGTLQQLLAEAETAALAAAAAEQAGTAEAAAAAAEAAAAEDAAVAAADAAAAVAQATAAEETPDTGAAGTQWFAHEGILNCAKAIRADLDRLGLLDQLLLGIDSSSSGSSSSTGNGSGSGGNISSQAPQDVEQPSSGGLGANGDTWSRPAATATAAAAAGCGLGSNSKSAAGADAAGMAAGSGTGNAGSRRQWPDCRGWTLLVTGHSLGAGVAAMLALHFRCRYPAVRVWCFAPPGGLLSPAAAASLKDICYSLVSGKDMIPRMSLWTVERLRDEMMLCALRCKMPKYKLLLGILLGRNWEEEDVLASLPLQPAAAQRYTAYRDDVTNERILDPLRVRIAREFVPPGQVIWLQRFKDERSKPRIMPLQRTAGAAAAAAAPAASAGSSTAGQQRLPGGALSAMGGWRSVNRVQPHFTDGLNLIVGGMVVSRNMFADHLPDAQMAQLKRLVRRLQRQQQEQQLAAGSSSQGRGGADLRPPVVQEMQGARGPRQYKGRGLTVKFAT